MILILTKHVEDDNSISAKVTLVQEGVFEVGDLHFPTKISWTRFIGALQRGGVGMRDFEIRLDVKTSEVVNEN